MGIFDWILGDKETDTTSEFAKNEKATVDKTSVGVVNKDTSVQSGTVQGSQQNVAGTQSNQTKTLDDGSISALQSGIGSMSGAVGAEFGIYSNEAVDSASRNAALAAFMAERAKETEDKILGTFDAQAAAEVNRFERGTVGDVNALASKVGSQDNSFVQLLLNQGRQQLGTNLADLKAKVATTASQLGSADLVSAVSAETQVGKDFRSLNEGRVLAAQSLATLANALKGAMSTSDSTIAQTTNTLTETQNTTNTNDNIVQVGQDNVNQETNSSGTGSGSSDTGGTLLDWISVLNRR